jgi:hypothetical protein
MAVFDSEGNEITLAEMGQQIGDLLAVDAEHRLDSKQEHMQALVDDANRWQAAYNRVCDENVSLKEALRLIDSPYPESIFRPLIRPELDALHAAMRRTAVSNPTERLYSQHARERGEAVRSSLRDKSPTSGPAQ